MMGSPANTFTFSATDWAICAAGILFIFFILPQFGEFWTMVGCASMFSTIVYRSPDSYRDRSGSLNLAIGLVSFLWMLTGIVGLIGLFG